MCVDSMHHVQLRASKTIFIRRKEKSVYMWGICHYNYASVSRLQFLREQQRIYRVRRREKEKGKEIETERKGKGICHLQLRECAGEAIPFRGNYSKWLIAKQQRLDIEAKREAQRSGTFLYSLSLTIVPF